MHSQGAADHTTHGHLVRFYARNVSEGDSPRVQRLEWFEAFFRCLEHEGKTHDFKGRTLNSSQIGQGNGVVGLPPGFTDWKERSQDVVPFHKRRPPAPVRLVRTVVQRFTGMLFSDGRRPTVRVLGDSDTEDWLEGVISAGQLWAAMIETRDNGGSMGTAVISFAFRDGHPVFEVHNPKHCIPTWADRGRGILAALDITYRYPKEVRTRKGWKTKWFWYRRRIDRTWDVTYQPIEVAPGVLPGDEKHPWVAASWARHDFGFCPVEWIQNTRNSDGIDGDPDCEGQYDTALEIDIERGLAGEGLKPNCDPTVHLATDRKVSEIKKGSGNALVTEKGGSARYMEITGSGSDAARANADSLEAGFLQAVACVIDGEGTTGTTATEIRHRYHAMFNRVSLFRTQYGEGVRRLLDKVVRAGLQLTAKQPPKPTDSPTPIDERRKLTIDKELPPSPDLPDADDGEDETDNRPVVYSIKLPPKVIENLDDPDAEPQLIERQLGHGDGVIQVIWPEHVTPTSAEINQMIDGLVKAEAAGYIDGETAAKQLANYMGLQDASAVYRKAQAQRIEREGAAMAAMTAQLGGGAQEEPDDDEFGDDTP